MAETPSKRQREEAEIEDIEETKRYKSYSHILSLLEDEEDESSSDLSSFITNLQQEISSDLILDNLPCPNSTETDHENNPTNASSTTLEDCTTESSTSSCSKEDVEDDRERVIRHLLEASDDELGIPNIEVGVNSAEYGEIGLSGGDEGFALGDGLWELEDQTANYYTLLQSQLFM